MNNYLDKFRESILKVKYAWRVLKGENIIFTEYKFNPKPRYGYSRPPHKKLYELLDKNKNEYLNYLTLFLKYSEKLSKIELKNPTSFCEPCWINGWLPALDSISIYCMIAIHKPRTFYEIGSGWSTKFARKAIVDNDLKSLIVSIDPSPRAEIDLLCDSNIRKPLEEIDLTLFGDMQKGDILFVDCSHYCFMNSDVTVFFLDILPNLKPGVIVAIHDILLPLDYPHEWSCRFYSEQYLLASYLLSGSNKLEILLPNSFIISENSLKNIISPLFQIKNLRLAEHHGSCFWIRIS